MISQPLNHVQHNRDLIGWPRGIYSSFLISLSNQIKDGGAGVPPHPQLAGGELQVLPAPGLQQDDAQPPAQGPCHLVLQIRIRIKFYSYS
jgi:hypothetical protein